MRWTFLTYNGQKLQFFAEKFGGFVFFSYFCNDFMHMKRRVIIVSAVLALTLFAPVTASSSMLKGYAAGVMDFQESEVTISFSQGAIYVSGGEGMTLEVVSLTGKKVLEQQIDSPSPKFELNIPKGCYIVKVGKVVRKVSIH